MGMTVIIIGLLQLINALIRPHPPQKGEARALKCLVWEIVHKCSGYTAIGCLSNCVWNLHYS